MDGRLETSIWNLTFVAAAAACGPTIPIDDDDGDESFDDSGSATIDGDTTVDPPCDEDCPECQSDDDCDPQHYCSPSGTCEYYYYCGAAPGEDVFRCSPPPYYDCYSDADCGPDYRCVYYECFPIECDPDAAYHGTYDIAKPDEPIVDLAFVDRDGSAPQDLAIVTSTRLVLASSFSPALTQIVEGEDFIAAAAGDVDGDGDIDLVVAERGQGGHLVVVTNEDAVLTPFATLASPGVAVELVLGDPENDGALDAFVRTETGIVRHVDLVGDPTPVVATPSQAMALAGWSLAYATDGRSWWLPVATLVPTDPSEIWEIEMQSFATARLDDDVDPDLFGAVDAEGTTHLFAWRGPIAALDAHVTLAGNYPDVAAADVNGDGHSEPVLVGDGQVIVLSSSPDSADAYGCQSAIALSHAALTMAAGDWDGDAAQELVISDGNNLTLLDQNAKGE